MNFLKTSLYIILGITWFISLSSPGVTMESFSEEGTSTSVKRNQNAGSEDLGNTFYFISERGERIKRSIEDYKIENVEIYNLVSKKKAIIFGGTHLTDVQAFELSKKYAQEGKIDLMINAGVALHDGHTVINLDPETRPDYKEDFTTDSLVKNLGLASQFEIASFENVKPSLTLCKSSLINAWDALIPGGKLIIYPATPFFLEMLLGQIGFTDIRFIESGYKDILTDRLLAFPACFATKPKSQQQ